jgi:hypothetical protein
VRLSREELEDIVECLELTVTGEAKATNTYLNLYQRVDTTPFV